MPRRLRALKFWIIVFFISICFSLPAKAQVWMWGPYEKDSAYKPLRYDEDYSYLKDPAKRSDFFDPIKYIRLRPGRDDWYVSFGGEIKERYECWKNPLWGQEGVSHERFLLQRYMLHADFHFGPLARVFLQLRSALKTGGMPPQPIDQDRFDLHQGFIDLRVFSGRDSSFTVRAGRQELLYGSSRLVSVREGSNIRRAFDGFKTMLKAGAWKIDSWVTRPVAIKDSSAGTPLFFDAFDQQNNKVLFWGIYAVHPLTSGLNQDLYYLGLRQKKATYNQGRASETRQTVGTRFWGKSEGWDYDLEMVYQFGSFDGGRINAWMIAGHTGYTFRSALLKPRLAVKIEWASGDRNPKNTALNTFNPLFHNSLLFNETDLVGLSNILDLHPYLSIHPTENWGLSADCCFFWRESRFDGVYNNIMQLERAAPPPTRKNPSPATGAYIGTALSGFSKWQVNRHLAVYAAYTHFFPGSFIEESGPSKSVDFFGVWGRYLY